MKNAPFLLSSALALLAVVLSFVSFDASQTNNRLQSELLTKQTKFQGLNNEVNLLNQEYQRQAEIINTGANLGQKVISPILVEMGYVTTKNKNAKFREILNETEFQKAIPDDKTFEEMTKAIDAAKAKQGGAAAPAPTTQKPAPTPAPAPATGNGN